MQLLADVVFKRRAGEDGYIQRSKFLETVVVFGRGSYRSTPSLTRDVDLIVL